MNFSIHEWKSEFSIKTLWSSRKWTEILQCFFTTLIISFTPSIFDMSTDFSSTFTYFYGTHYTKHIQNISGITKEECTMMKTTVTTNHMTNQTIETFTVSCFEKDYIYSAVTFFFTLLPSAIFVYCGVIQGTLSLRRWYSIISIPLLLLTFPIQLIMVKLLHLINPGKQMAILSEVYGFCESQGESTFQLCAQLFMVLSHADREASMMQILSIVASSVTVVKPSLEQFLGKKKHQGSFEDILSKYFKYIPLFFSTTIFRILSMAMICVLLRWNAFYFYAIIYGSALLLRLIFKRFSSLNFLLFANIIPENLTITRSYTYNNTSRKETLSNMLLWTSVNCVTLTTLAILGNYNHLLNIQVPTFYPFIQAYHYWTDIPLVQNIATFNTLYAFNIGSGDTHVNTQKEEKKIIHSHFLKVVKATYMIMSGAKHFSSEL